MSFTNFLINGINVADNSYNRFNHSFPQDKATVLSPTYEYKGAITRSEDSGNVFKRTLDNAVQVTTVTNHTRDAKLNFWDKRSFQSLILGIGGTALGIAGTAAAALTASAATPIASVAVAVGGIALAILSFNRRHQANEQYKAWQDPIAKYQELRAKTLSGGFYHVYSHKLKNSLIHPQECRELYIDWAKTTMPKYQKLGVKNGYATPVTEDIKEFFKSNPLDADIVKYAFENVARPPEFVGRLSSFYTDLKIDYSGVRNKATVSKNKLYSEKQHLINKNESQRQAWLAPAKISRNMMISNAKNEKSRQTQTQKLIFRNTIEQINRRFSNQRITQVTQNEKNQAIAAAKRNYDNKSIVSRARQDYRSKCIKYQCLYEIAAAPINLHFNNNDQKIKEWANYEIQKVNKKENRQINSFAGDVEGIAKAYVNASHYERIQTNRDDREHLYPQLPTFYNYQEAYRMPSANDSRYNAVDMNQFYGHIYQQPVPSVLPSAPQQEDESDHEFPLYGN